MEMTVYNTAKHRLETINMEITKKNSTWFDDNIDTDSVSIITDFKDGLLIKQCNYNYPMWFFDVHGQISVIAAKRHKTFCLYASE